MIQPGDKLLVRQLQTAAAQGGVGLDFTDGTYTPGYNILDQDGQYMFSDTVSGQWHYRKFDLSLVAGKTVAFAWVVTEGFTPYGPWSISYQDYVLLSADGTVHKLYARDKSVVSDMWGTAGVTGRSISVEPRHRLRARSDQTTTFYHGDHLGSSRLLSSANGYPTWQGTYYPYGMEYTPTPRSTTTPPPSTTTNSPAKNAMRNPGWITLGRGT